MWAIIYEAKLVGVCEENVLCNISYFGQSLPKYKKYSTPEEVLKKRNLQHCSLALREDKELGFMNVLRIYGPDAFEWKIVESKYDEYEEAQKWADNREKYYIEQNGGIMRDMDKKLIQTFNLQSGGQGDPKKIFESLEARSNKKWYKFKIHLQEFYRKKGNINILSSYVCDDKYKLGQTVVSVRGGNMIHFINSEERKEFLDNFPGWTWNINNELFDKFYTELCKYKDEYGDCNVPQVYITEQDYLLGSILNAVRQGRYIKDFPERKQKLDELGVSWHPQAEYHDETWEKIKDELLAYYVNNGNSNVPLDSQLGKYVGHIRCRQDFIKDNPERLTFLKSINFSWNVKVDQEEESWLEFWTHMVKFYTENEHSDVPATFKCEKDKYALGSRCVSIRHNNQYMNDLSKKQQLEEIGFSWSPLDDNWDKFWKEICKYKTKHLDCKVDGGYTTSSGYRLGQTVSTVRKGIYIKNFPERKKQLNEIGFIWNVFDKAWDKFLEHLIEYMKNNNDSCKNITKTYVSPDKYKLGSSINNIKSREQFIKNKPERKAILQKLGVQI